MRVTILLLCASCFINIAQAAALSDVDRETLLERLEKIQDASDSNINARYRIAMAAYNNAVGSNEAAIELYLDCMEKVNFKDQQKKATDFREWKRKESEKLADPGLRIAIHYQLRWLILSLQATSEKADRAKLAGEAQQVVDAIFSDPAKLKNQAALLSQAVTSSVFARAYAIDSVKVEDWPLSPTQLDQIYDQLLLPPYRSPDRAAELRTTWIKRILQEGAKAEHWVADRKEDKRIGMASAMQPPTYEKFLEEVQPKLQWEMELDLFHNGDESGASVRMLAHLQKYLNHPSAREWGEQFKKLLKPEVAAAPLKTAGVAPQ
mgnify:FL=1